MKVAKDRKYTDAFRTSAVSQVLEGGRRQAAVARSLEISVKTLANWVGKARSGKGLTKGGANADLGRSGQGVTAATRGRDVTDGARHSKTGGGVLRQGVDVKYAWIEVFAKLWPIDVMCRMLGVSVSGYFEAQRRPAGGSARQIANAATAVRRAAIQKRHRGRYGRRRMLRELRNAGEVVNHKRVSRLMQEHGLQSRVRRRLRVVTTDSKHLYPIAQNVLARDFSADAPNRK